MVWGRNNWLKMRLWTCSKSCCGMAVPTILKMAIAFPTMWQVWWLNGSWIVVAQSISHQKKVISLNTGNSIKRAKLKLQMGNTSQLKVAGQLSDIAWCLMRWHPCRSEMCYLSLRWISGYICWLPQDNVIVCPKQQKRVQLWPRMAPHSLSANQSQENCIPSSANSDFGHRCGKNP